MTQQRVQRGFTLLEVMVAVVILATALGLLLGMLSRGMKQVADSQSATEATLYAQSLLDQVGTMQDIAPMARGGSFANGRYHWRLQVVPARDPAPPPPPQENAPAPQVVQTDSAPVLYRVVLDVQWGAATPAQQLRFQTLRLRAPTLEGGEDAAANEAAADALADTPAPTR
jgi:general secretion pathway protein I